MKILSLLLASVFILSAVPAAVETTVPRAVSVGSSVAGNVSAVIGAPEEAASDPVDSCVSNGVLTAQVYDPTGVFSFNMGNCADAGVAADSIMFPLGTSFATVADFTTGVDYTEGGDGGGAPLGTPTNSSVVGSSIITVFPPTPEGLIVTQSITVEGNATDSAILMNLKVVNTGGSSQEVGVRYLWDIDVGGYDGTWLQEYDRTTAGAITGYETVYSPPPANFTLYALGGCSQGSMLPPPYVCDPSDFGAGSGTFVVYGSIFSALGATYPARFVYGWWRAMSDTVYAYTPDPSDEVGSYVPDVGGVQDSAVLYYFSNETLAGNGGALSDQADVSNSLALLQIPPSISLAPTSGVAQTVVAVAGAGLTPSKTLTLTSFGSLGPIPLRGSCVTDVWGTVTSSAGCTFSVPASIPVGVYTLRFSDGIHSPTATFTVVAATKTTVSCKPRGAHAGSPTVITCDAKVTGHAPTGDVTWSQDGVGGVSILAGMCTLSMGTCSVALKGAKPGTVEVQATYGGDSSNSPSSGTRKLVIAKGTPRVMITCTSSTLRVGESATCTATLSGGYLPPMGTIVWEKDYGPWVIPAGWSSSLGSAAFSPNSCTIDSGSCSVTVTATARGVFMIIAYYIGDANDFGTHSWYYLPIVAR